MTKVGGIILKVLSSRIVITGAEWIDLAQGRDKWRAFCEHGNENLRVPQNADDF